jgi:hypothetical protein
MIKHNSWGEPDYFSYLESVRLRNIVWKAQTSDTYFLAFTAGNTEDPKTEPVGVVHYAGIRRILWRDRLWTECDVNSYSIETEAKKCVVQARKKNAVAIILYLEKVILFNEIHKLCGPPLLPAKVGTLFVRAIRPVNE